MATRVNRKNASTTWPKEVVAAEKQFSKNEAQTEAVSKSNTSKTAGVKGTSIGRKLVKKNPPRKILKKTSGAINLKTKSKKPVKLNQKLAKTILQNVKTLEGRKKLLKNSVKEVKPRKKKAQIKKEKDDSPPVLEPIFPIEENVENKKQPKKRFAKKTLKNSADLTDSKKIKIENDDNLSVASDVTDISNDIPNLPKQVRKPRGLKKPKVENDTLEDVMNDLSFLIKGEEIKKEIDSMSESGKSDTPIKPKKLTKKQRIEILKKKIIKKENLENTLSKLDSSDEKVIDMLDLNVRKVKKKSSLTKRRHSIEKFPIGSAEICESPMPQLSLFNHLPRSISPRSKRNTKARQSIDGICRRSSPYTTRSESPARMLRNGKQRKLKDLNLLDGLDSDVRKRRRLCSDLSGSEISISKMSGYESDSSYSDLASLHGAENNDLKELETSGKCNVRKELLDEDVDIKPTCGVPINKTSPSEIVTNGPTDSLKLIDTNSNLCSSLNPVDINLNDRKEIKKEPTEDSAMYPISPSTKVPEKSIILGIMKQAFNDIGEEKSKTVKKVNPETEPVLVTTFYGNTVTSQKEEKSLDSETESPLLTRLNSDLVKDDEESETIMDRTVNNQIEENSNETECIDANRFHKQKEVGSEIETKFADDAVKSVLEDDTTESNNLPPSTQTALKHLEDLIEKIEPEERISETYSGEPLASIKETELAIEEAENKKSTQIDSETEGSMEPRIDPSVDENELEPNDVNISGKKNPAQTTNDDENISGIDESAEELAEKESILKALGLQSLKAAEEAKQKCKERPSSKSDSYTGTLKTVIKINRDKKKGRNSFKMTLQKNKGKPVENEQVVIEESYKVTKEGASSTWKQGTQSSDTAGAHRKSHYSNRSNMDGSSEHTSDGEAVSQDGAIKALVIPEKASSFSIHPGRLCKDECSYCFGKFGLFDTPCHIAQMKSVERQNKILATEKHLTRDSCLCDACYRHVDRKSNTPSYTNKSLKRNSLVAPGPRQNHCHVLGCNKVSTNILRRKWIIKMRKSICQVINIDLDNPGLHSIPICDEHYSALEHLMVCAMCKRRLARNHIHYLGPEVNDLNNALNCVGIPLMLTDKPVVCKLCKCFASIILKNPEDRPENSVSFFKEYKRRLLHFNDIVPMDEAAAEEPIIVPSKSERSEQIKKKRKIGKNMPANEGDSANQEDCQETIENPEKIQDRVPSTDTNSQPQSRSESPTDEYNSVDYNTLIPAIAMDCGSDTESKKDFPKKKPPVIIKKIQRVESIKEAVEISKILKADDKNKHSDVAVAKLGSNPSISVRQLFPGEEDLPLNANIEFNSIKDRTPEGWEKCNSIIQYDLETKRLWQELQKPYGNQSSFLRHLILLEKYFRNGDLILSPNASHHSINYSESVHNRLRAYDNIPTSAGNIQPISMLPFNKMQKSNSGIITSTNIVTGTSLSVPSNTTSTNLSTSNYSSTVSVTSVSNSSSKNTPITLSQLNSPPLIPTNAVLQQIRPKMVGAPPGLISLHPGTNKPVAPLVKVPQSQKIKFPITKNWRPNLIPIDPTKKQERKVGLVQVISGGKPYHITLEDYKKMCAIKRSFEMKQKRLQEAQNPKPIFVTHNSVLKSIIPRKGLIISKTAAATSPVKTELTPTQNENNTESENILEKLDKQVEKLESKLNEKPSSLLLPKIPKSLTVIPQTVTRKSSRPSSPVLLITPKNTSSKS